MSGLPHVWVFDNSAMDHPFRTLAVFQDGERIEKSAPWPEWFAARMAAAG